MPTKVEQIHLTGQNQCDFCSFTAGNYVGQTVNTHHDNFCEYHIISYELHYRPTLTQVGTYIVHMMYLLI